MENKKSLTVSDVHYSYDKGAEILHGVSASFSSGKITALIGANGCGKSTLLNLAAGVMKPDKGSILLNGENISTLKRTVVAQSIAAVHQNNTAPDDMTVEKLVSAGRTPYHSMFKKSCEEDNRAVERALEDTDIKKYAHRTVSSLSGGQLQRAWLAMALAQETDILLLDEITTYLDIHYQIEIMHLIRELNVKKGITVVMVLHDINLALEFCDEVIIMKNGFITAQGNIGEAVTENILNEAFEVSSKIMLAEGKKHCLFSRKGEVYGA
jgi:iron complex transport system ATP-binding protein